MSPKRLVAPLILALSLPAWGAAPVADDLLGRTVFQVLLGELALRDGAVDLSLDAWADLAERTRDPKVIARAVEIAGFAGHNERGLRLVRLWQSVEPDSEKARQAQVALLIQARRTDQLATPLASLLAADRDNLENNLLHLNRMLARIGDKAALLGLLETLTAPYQTLPEAHFALAQAALAASDEARAREETGKALALRPDWEMAAIAHAKLIGRQDMPAAIEQLQKFVARHADASDVRLALAQMLVSQQRFGEARKQYGKLLDKHPDNPDILYPAAILALQSGDTSSGRLQLERLLDTPFTDKSSIQFLLGQIAQEAGQNDQALEHFRQVVAGERYIAARARSAALLLKQQKPQEALELLRATRGKTAGERTQLAIAEAQLLRETGDHAGAYAALEKALASSPDDPDLRYDAALTAEKLRRYDAMESHLKHILRSHPDHAHALNALGYSLVERNTRLAEAEQLLTQALALAPTDAYIMDSMGWLQYRRGQLSEALATLEKAYSLKADPEIAAHLGEVLWQLDRRDEAQRIWEQAQQRDPGNAALNATREKFRP